MGDRRRLNNVWIHQNPLDEFILFGRVGSGKNETVVTLGSAKSEKDAGLIKQRGEHYVGRMWQDLEGLAINPQNGDDVVKVINYKGYDGRGYVMHDGMFPAGRGQDAVKKMIRDKTPQLKKVQPS